MKAGKASCLMKFGEYAKILRLDADPLGTTYSLLNQVASPLSHSIGIMYPIEVQVGAVELCCPFQI